ncbi:hypothetical protein Daus18300_005286 [Diaporthe australafricana]|uniref:F-box domain-containing protein n=1 Tax=Diaporthe australafricana TaxID=127596 RepID=A0ABR3X3A3_9PEZI
MDRIPAKVLIRIAENCLSTQDLAALTMVSSRYAEILKPLLLEKKVGIENVDSPRPSAIPATVAVMAAPQSRDYLARLPAEILLHIAEDPSLSTADLAAFARTSSRFNGVATATLYKKNIREEHANALLWAVMTESTDTLARLVQYGADINSVGASLHLGLPSPYKWIKHLRRWDSHAATDKMASQFRSASNNNGTNRTGISPSSVTSFDQTVARYTFAGPASATPAPMSTIPAAVPQVTAPFVPVAQAPIPVAQAPVPAAQASVQTAPMHGALMNTAPIPMAPISLAQFQLLASAPAAALPTISMVRARVPRERARKRPIECTPLALAARRGLTRAASWLLQHGADTEIPALDLCGCDNELMRSKGMWRTQPSEEMDQPHWTALHLAVHYDHGDVVQLLVANGANARQVCRPEDGPCNVLHTAFAHKRESIIKSLVCGLQQTNLVEINSRGRGGITPLHMAYCLGDMGLVKLALRLGAYVNLEYDFNGNEWTLFAMACAERDWPFALRLMKLGANPNFNLTTRYRWQWTMQSLLNDIEGSSSECAAALRDELVCFQRDQEVAWL